MKHLASFVLCVAVAAATPVQAQDGTRTERVQFPRGSTGTTISDSITGYEAVEYLVGAQAGQEMTVVLKSDHLSTYINVFEPGTKPGTDEAISIGSDDGTRYEGTLPSDGDYLIQVYMMRSAARRGEVAHYALDVSITGAPGAASTSKAPSAVSASGHVLDWPARFDATGEVECSAGGATLGQWCEFRVVRGSFGATLWVVKPGTDTDVRVLYFESDAWSSDDDSKLSWDRKTDDWLVKVDGKEFYLVFDEVIWGG